MVRMTSKERIQRMAEEAAVAEKTKTEKKKTSTRRKETVIKEMARKRYKAVWKVLDGSYKENASFPYSEKDKAYAKADELNKNKDNKTYFVIEGKVSMDE